MPRGVVLTARCFLVAGTGFVAGEHRPLLATEVDRGVFQDNERSEFRGVKTRRRI